MSCLTETERKRLANKKKNDGRRARKKAQKAFEEQHPTYWGPYIATSPSDSTLACCFCARGYFVTPREGVEMVLVYQLAGFPEEHLKMWGRLCGWTKSHPFCHGRVDEDGRRACEMSGATVGRVVELEEEGVVRMESGWCVDMDSTKGMAATGLNITDTEIN